MPKAIHIMWTINTTWCGLSNVQNRTHGANSVRAITCKNCLKSPFAGEYFMSEKLENRYRELYDKYVDRFCLRESEVSKAVAVRLLKIAKQSI